MSFEALKDVDIKNIFYESFQQFADHGIYQTPEYIKAEIYFDAENYLTIPHYMRKGVANVVSRVAIIQQMEDEEKRMKLMRQRENGGIPAEWFNIMLDWLPGERDDQGELIDPIGTGKLRECRDHDGRKIINDITEEVDSIEESELRRHVEAMLTAEDILIDYYHMKRLIFGV